MVLIALWAALCFVLPAGAADLAVVDAFFEDHQRLIVRKQQLPAGDTAYLSFRVAGFKRNDDNQVKISYTIECLDPAQAPLVEPYSRTIEETLARQDQNWRPKIDYSLVVPTFAPSGQYVVNIKVRDEFSGTEVLHPMPFVVKGESVESSGVLAVRDFQFADSARGPTKSAPVFRQGTTLWARYKLVGFRVSPEKQIDVEQDLFVLNADGEVLFTRPQAAEEKHTMFYPPRFLSEAFNLEVQPSVKPGDYIIRLDIRDLLGNQTITHEAKFTVVE